MNEIGAAAQVRGTSRLWRVTGILSFVTAGLILLLAASLWTGGWLFPIDVSRGSSLVEIVLTVLAGVLILTHRPIAAPWLLLAAFIIGEGVGRVVTNGYGVYYPWAAIWYSIDGAEYPSVLMQAGDVAGDVAFWTLLAAVILAFIALIRGASQSRSALAGRVTQSGGQLMGTPETVPAGWYADPSGLPSDRYWDGQAWTEQTRPATSGHMSMRPVPGAGSSGPRNGMGTAALTLGILGLFLGWIFSLLGIIFGAIGVGRANRGEASNRGAAMWGMWLGIVGFALWIFAVIVITASV